MKVSFIVHGSASIGMGHIIRSLSLAEAFRESGHEVDFFSKYKLGIELIQRKGFEVECIPDQSGETKIDKFFYGNIKEALQDAEYICCQIKGVTDVLVVDSYNVNADFFTVLKEKTKCLVYVDDLNAFLYPVDIIINGSASAPYMGYEKIQNAKLFLGLPYNLIRKEFRAVPARNICEKVTEILITTGNSDPCHMTEKILDILKCSELFKDLSFHVIIGSGFETESLSMLDIVNEQSIHLHYKPENILEIMMKCDLAITAGGSTLYELAACGVPAIVFAYAENQIPQIKAMEEEKLLKYVGFYQTIDKINLLESISAMQEQYVFRKRLVEKLQLLVDAKGALRVVKEIEEILMRRNKIL